MTFKANIGTDPRVIYTLFGGSDSEDGISLETAKATIQGAIDAVNALIPFPSALNPAKIIVSGAGVFDESVSFPNFTSVDAPTTTNALFTGTNYTIGSFSNYSFGLTANSGTSQTIFNVASETAVSLSCSEVNITGPTTTCLAISGTTDDSFFRFSQLRLNGDGSIGVNYTASNGEPEVILFASITLEDDNVVAYIHNPSVSTARAIFDVAGITEIGSPTNTTAIRVIDGHLSAFVNEINAGDAIDLQGGELAIISNCITGDITVAVGSTLICEITEFTGVLTNNGTIQGRIGTQQFGSGFVTGPGPSVVNQSIPVFSGTGGETIQNIDNATLTDNGTTLEMFLNSPSATGSSRYALRDSSGSLKFEMEYEETGDTIEFLTTVDMSFGQGPSAGTISFIGNDTEFLFQTAGTDNALTIDMTGGPDTNPPFIIDNGGTNGGVVNFFVGDRNPEGNVSADPGSVYYRIDGVNSRIFHLESATTANTPWVSHEGGDVDGPATSTNTAIARWGSGGVGEDLLDSPDALLVQSGTQSKIELTSPDITAGLAAVDFFDSTSAQQLRIGYTEVLGGSSFITTFGATDFTLQVQDTGATVGALSILHSDTTPLLRMQTFSGAGAIVLYHFGDRNPETNVSAPGGRFYFRNDGVDTNLYIKQSAGTSTADWNPAVTTANQSGTDNALVTLDGATGNLVQEVVNSTLVNDGTNVTLTLQSPVASGDPIIILNNDTGGEELRIQFDDSQNDVDIIASDDFFISSTSSISMTCPDGLTIDSTADLLTLNGNAGVNVTADTGSINLTATNAAGFLIFQGTNAPDTQHLIRMITGGANGSSVDFHVGTRTPEGNVNGEPGSFYFRDDGVNSDLYVHRAASAGTTGWVDFLATGVKSSDTTTVDNSLVIWDGTDGSTVEGRDLITAGTSNLNFTSSGGAGTPGFQLFDSLSVLQTSFTYRESSDDTLVVVDSGNGFEILALNGGITLNGGDDIIINANSGANLVTINTDFVFGATTTDAIMQIESPTATGEASIEFQNNASVDRLKVGYDQNTDIATIETFLDTTDLLITSEEQAVEINVQITQNNPILKLSNSQNDFDIYSRDNDPEATVSGTNGDIVIGANGFADTAIYLNKGSTSNTSWALVDCMQKLFTTVSTTSTLTQGRNRVLVTNVADIVLSLPTPGTSSRANGFEQIVSKISANTDIVTLATPGFYGHTGNFVMSQRGDSVTYIQDNSSNQILYTNRNVFAIIERTGNAENSIAGSTGADILLDGFNTNTATYNGLSEADQANDQITFSDVENLSAGDLYELELNLVCRWSNNSFINFFASVDDAGVVTDFNIIMEAQSTGTANEVTLFGKTQIRTGNNDTISLDTDVQIFFALPTGDTLFFKQGWLKVTKIEGR